MDKWIHTWIEAVRVHLQIQLLAQGCSSEGLLVTSWLKFQNRFFHVLSFRMLKFHSKNWFPYRNIQKLSCSFFSIAVLRLSIPLPSRENNATCFSCSLQSRVCLYIIVVAFSMQKTFQNIPQFSPNSRTFSEKKNKEKRTTQKKHIQNKISTARKNTFGKASSFLFQIPPFPTIYSSSLKGAQVKNIEK